MSDSLYLLNVSPLPFPYFFLNWTPGGLDLFSYHNFNLCWFSSPTPPLALPTDVTSTFSHFWVRVNEKTRWMKFATPVSCVLLLDNSWQTPQTDVLASWNRLTVSASLLKWFKSSEVWEWDEKLPVAWVPCCRSGWGRAPVWGWAVSINWVTAPSESPSLPWGSCARMTPLH